jgi:aminoglycoside 3-N-acetyltransferase
VKKEVFSINSLRNQLSELGVQSGDLLFIAADLMKLGYFNKNRTQTLDDIVDMLISLVGEDGTIVIPSYTNFFFRFRKRPEIIFNQTVDSTSGSLSNHLLKHPRVLRSSHPTNSLIAIGKYAEYILKNHDEYSSSYSPYLKVIELGGKNLMLGCFSDFSLAPMALHAAQEKLGYTSKHWMSGLLQTYFYNRKGEKKLFTRYDIGGCAAGAHKVLGYHFKNSAIDILKTGNSISALINTKKSYGIFFEILHKSPEIIRCDDSTCHDCYGSSVYNPKIFIFHWIAFFIRKLFSIKKAIQ